MFKASHYCTLINLIEVDNDDDIDVKNPFFKITLVPRHVSKDLFFILFDNIVPAKAKFRNEKTWFLPCFDVFAL